MFFSHFHWIDNWANQVTWHFSSVNILWIKQNFPPFRLQKIFVRQTKKFTHDSDLALINHFYLIQNFLLNIIMTSRLKWPLINSTLRNKVSHKFSATFRIKGNILSLSFTILCLPVEHFMAVALLTLTEHWKAERDSNWLHTTRTVLKNSGSMAWTKHT